MRANALSEVDGATDLLNLGACERKTESGKVISCLYFLLVDVCNWLSNNNLCYKLKR